MTEGKSTAKKATAAPKKPAKPASHPKYIDMVIAAIKDLKERNGSSRQAILKYVMANYKVTDNASHHVKLALKRGVTGGDLNQVKGTGASGSFKLPKAESKPKQKKVAAAAPAKKTAKKPAAKKSSAKKPAAPAKKATPKKKAATPKKSSSAKKAKPAAKKAAASKPKAKKASKKPAAAAKKTKK